MKHIFKFYIFVIILLVFPTVVLAEGDVSCSVVNDTVDKYNTLIDKIASTNCDSIYTNEELKECNNNEMNRVALLSKIFQYNNSKKSECNSQISSIVEENKESCSSVFDSDFKELISSLMNIFYIVAPFLLIIFGSIDFFTIVTAGNPVSSSSKGSPASVAKRKFFKRVIAFVLLYFIPVIINIILGLNGSEYDLSGNPYVCKSSTYNINIVNVNEGINALSQILERIISPSGRSVTTTDDNSSTTGGTTGTYTYSTSASLGTKSNNGAFPIRGNNDRVTANSAPEYYVEGKTVSFQCVWYARARAQEIIGTSTTLTSEEKKERIELLNKAGGNGWEWYKIAQGNGSLSRFQSSNNYKDVRAGSIVAWTGGNVRCSNGPDGKCGHVGIIEDYNPSTGLVRVSEAGRNGGTWSTYFWASGEGTLESSVLNKGNGKYKFQGYVYLLEPLK